MAHFVAWYIYISSIALILGCWLGLCVLVAMDVIVDRRHEEEEDPPWVKNVRGEGVPQI